MTKISSGSTFMMKRVFPTVWFGVLIIVVGAFVTSAIKRGAMPGQAATLVVPIFMAFIGYTVMKRLIWDLMDEVYDHGDYLVIKNKGEEVRLDLADIMNVSASTNINPPRITLRLVHPTKFGTEVSFSPVRTFSFNPFAKNEVAESLIVRVDRARSQRRS